MKNVSFLDVSPFDSDKNRQEASELGTLAVTGNRNTLLIYIILMMEAPHSSETPLLTRTTRRNIPEDGILHLMSPSPNVPRPPI
jgi:hypothetical protein